MPEQLIDVMTRFAALVRRYRASETAKVTQGLGFSERDVTILEFLNHKHRATFAEIARFLRVSDAQRAAPSTISQAVTSLWKTHALVAKEPNRDDQRQPIVSLTDKGEKLVKQIEAVQQDVVERVKAAMKPTRSEVTVLQTVFLRGLQNFEKFVEGKDR